MNFQQKVQHSICERNIFISCMFIKNFIMLKIVPIISSHSTGYIKMRLWNKLVLRKKLSKILAHNTMFYWKKSSKNEPRKCPRNVIQNNLHAKNRHCKKETNVPSTYYTHLSSPHWTLQTINKHRSRIVRIITGIPSPLKAL